jgi:hypothetical protein
MSEEITPINRKSDHWVDALAAVALIGIFVTGLVYWITSQG